MPNEKRYFGEGLPYLSLEGLKGKLIAIEGPDGVGRSTHIESIQEWLEVQGYGVLTTGWTRSPLIGKTIENAKQGNILDPWSFTLLYATDFADRLEHQIIPALRSGFVVLSDRYIYTAFARNVVRGCARRRKFRRPCAPASCPCSRKAARSGSAKPPPRRPPQKRL